MLARMDLDYIVPGIRREGDRRICFGNGGGVLSRLLVSHAQVIIKGPVHQDLFQSTRCDLLQLATRGRLPTCHRDRIFQVLLLLGL